MWGNQLSLLSIMTPRNFVSLTSFITWPLSVTFTDSLLLLLFETLDSYIPPYRNTLPFETDINQLPAIFIALKISHTRFDHKKSGFRPYSAEIGFEQKFYYLLGIWEHITFRNWHQPTSCYFHSPQNFALHIWSQKNLISAIFGRFRPK